MWCMHTIEYYLPMKRNKSVSFAETWMDQETAVQSKTDKKEKNKQQILTHICGIKKSGRDDLICKPEIQTQLQRTNKWISRGKDREVG